MRLKRVHHLFLLVLCGPTLASCSTARMPEYTAPDSDMTSVSVVVSDGLQVTVDPFFDRERQKEFFAVDADAAGIAIIHLLFFNVSEASTFVLRKETFQLIRPRALGDKAVGRQDVERYWAGDSSAAQIGVLFVSPFSAAHLASEQSATQHNFTSKEFKDQTLSPGETAKGFVYFPLGEYDKWIDDASLLLTAKGTASRNSVELVVRLRGDRK